MTQGESGSSDQLEMIENLETVKHVLLDLNGTLVVGTYPDWGSILEGELKLRRRGEARVTMEGLRRVARGELTFEAYIRGIYEVQDVAGVTDAAFRIYSSYVRLREDAISVLEKLKERYDLSLCSDTVGVAKEVIRRLDLIKYFKRTFFSCDLKNLKSEKGFWMKCLSNFPHSTPSEFVMIGDKPRPDVYWPKRIGLRTILIKSAISSPQDWVDKPEGSAYEEPDARIETLKELLDLI